ncbi:gliding motility-associated C-terminal domain-containing protein [Aquimarina rhabdastrellae]
MKFFSHILVFVFTATFSIYAQELAFHNFGNVQIHDGATVGFHSDVINDGTFDQNLGKVGFYSNESIAISGNNKPIFHDMEVDVAQNIFLQVAVGITNFHEFINGKAITPRDLNTQTRDEIVSLHFIDDAPYLGEDNDRHVDGYASHTGSLDFTFPIGDDFRLRPLSVESLASVNTTRAAYFFENPNFPNTFPEVFDTSNIDENLFRVSLFEFWDLDGDTETEVTLTWDDNSNIPFLVEGNDNINNLRVVGWDSELEQWVNLGMTEISGDMDSGSVKSESFIPNRYTALTIGATTEILEGDFQIYNGVSANGDGFNDFFTIEDIDQHPNNELFIYNRWGVEVYHTRGYNNTWNGISEGRATIAKGEELPVGTYFYILKIDGQRNHSGYLYLSR